MIKLSHKTLKSKIAENHWTQEEVAEKADISDRQVRNLITNDTDSKLSVCYKLSRLFGTTMEELLVIQEEE